MTLDRKLNLRKKKMKILETKNTRINFTVHLYILISL